MKKKPINKSIAEYLAKHGNDENKIAELSEFIEAFFTDMDEEYEELAEAFQEEIEDFTEEITHEMLAAIIENLKHRDGTASGMKWSIEETNSLVPQYDVTGKIEAAGKHFCAEKFWFAMNYVYAVHYSTTRNIPAYIELALDELCNKNMCVDDMIKRIYDKI